MKDIRICLVETIRPGGIGFRAPLNVLYLASYLTEKKIVPQENITVIQTDFDSVIATIAQHKPHIVGFSAVTPNYDFAKKIAREARKVSRAVFILGGQHISGLPKVLAYPFDIGVIGEGEETFAELIVSYYDNDCHFDEAQLSKIKGIVFLRNKVPIITSQRPLIPSEDIPQINYSFITKERIYEYTTILDEERPVSVKLATMYSTRGCPYHCKFCAHQITWGNRSGLRFIPMKKVVDQIEFLYNVYGVDCINFLDDTFAYSKKRIRKLMEELQKRKLWKKVSFDNVFGRANLIDEEFVILLKQLGVKSIFFGIDSGSKRILDYLKNSSLTTVQVKNAVRLCGKHKIWVIGSFMLFSPREKESDIKKTLQLAKWFSREHYAQRLNSNVTTPYPGTPMWEETEKADILSVKGRPWHEFVMIKKNVFLKPFFKTTISYPRQEKLYNDLKKMAIAVQGRKEHLVGWYEAEKFNNDANNAMRNPFIARLRIKNRFIMFMHFPLSKLKKIVKAPHNMRFLIKDILNIFH